MGSHGRKKLTDVVAQVSIHSLKSCLLLSEKIIEDISTTLYYLFYGPFKTISLISFRQCTDRRKQAPGYKTFSMLNSAEHEIVTANKPQITD